MQRPRYWLILSVILSTTATIYAASVDDGASTGGYTFFLDGKQTSFPITSVVGKPGVPAPGDVVHVQGIPLTLGAERECHFRSAPEGVLLELPDGGTRWVGVRVEHVFVDDDYRLLDGMASLSEEQVRGLWGFRAEVWTPSCAMKSMLLDTPRVSLHLGQSVSRGTSDLPDLPRGVRYLEAARFLGWKNLAKLQGLVFLKAYPEEALDLRLLQGLLRLRFLRLGGANTLKHIEKLANLSTLESLDLGFHEYLTDISFAANLTHLRELRIRRTNVRDLTPLSGLVLLESVDARGTTVARLPEGALPALRKLNVMGTQLGKEAVDTFRSAHPQARVMHDWNQAFRDQIVGASQLRIMSNPLQGPPGSTRQTLYETNDAAEIAELVALLTIDEGASNSICLCICGPDFEFRQGDRLLTTASFACGSMIRWEEWPDDGALPIDKIPALIDWLARRGVTGPQDEAREDEARAKVYERKKERALTGLSQQLRAAFEQDGQIVRRTPTMPEDLSFPPLLAKEYPVADDRIRVLFRIFGAENGSWSGLDWEDRIADHMLRRYSRHQLARACEAGLLGEDRQVRRGAARLWESWKSPLANWRLERMLELRSVVLTVLQESRCPAQRQDALKSLQACWSKMPVSEREQRLQVGLRDPDVAVRRRAMLVAGQVGATSAEELLLRVLAGDAIEPVPLPPVPAQEEEDMDLYSELIAPDAPASEVAALALGYLRSRRAAPLIAERAGSSKSAPLRVAQALQDGRCDLLTTEDFRTKDDNQALQLAAVEAVVRCGGRHG